MFIYLTLIGTSKSDGWKYFGWVVHSQTLVVGVFLADVGSVVILEIGAASICIVFSTLRKTEKCFKQMTASFTRHAWLVSSTVLSLWWPVATVKRAPGYFIWSLDFWLTSKVFVSWFAKSFVFWSSILFHIIFFRKFCMELLILVNF